jgi:conjugative transposon protein traQ
MRKNIIDTKWVLGVLALAVFCLPACNRELDVQTAFPFTIEALPVQKEIVQGQTAEIRCTLNRTGNFADTHYTIRYFQPDGKGTLRIDNGTVFKPNDRYPLTRDNFRLYYTSRSAERQSIDIYIEDNFGQMKQLSFDFNSETLKE